MKFNRIIVTCLLGLGLATQAYAVTSIDQEQILTSQYIDNFAGGKSLAQSFQQTSDKISGAGIFLQPEVGLTDTLTIELWSTLPSSSGSGVPIVSASGSATSGSWFDVFWSPQLVVPDTTLFLVISGTNDTLGLAGEVGSSYTRGDAYFGNTDGSFTLSGFDYAFRTYTTVVPVPATAWLFATGLVGLIGVRRRLTETSV